MTNSISCVDRNDCFGCTACMSICKLSAITMKADSEGFMAPVLNESLCVNCGQCKNVCPAIQKWESTNPNQNEYYYYQNPDDLVLEKSTSGGAFMGIVESVEKPWVGGCIEDENLYIKHIITNDPDQISLMQGSKYTQSDIGDTFKQVKDALERDEQVVFSGTSCQIHGLLNYLEAVNVSRDKLVTIDLICHGVPSNLMHQEYIKYYELKKRKKPIRHIFRTKKQGWGTIFILKNYIQTLDFSRLGHDDKSLESQLYTNIFFSDLCLREACYNCPYCTENKPADITLADFWGIEDTDIINNEKGCSLIIARNNGKELLRKIKGANKLNEEQAAIAKKYQKHLITHNDRPTLRDDFWNDYYKYGFEFVAKKYLRAGFKYKILIFAYNYFKLFKHKRVAARLGNKIYY